MFLCFLKARFQGLSLFWCYPKAPLDFVGLAAIITFVLFLGVVMGKWFQALIPVKFALALNFKLPFLGESRGLLGHCCLFQS